MSSRCQQYDLKVPKEPKQQVKSTIYIVPHTNKVVTLKLHIKWDHQRPLATHQRSLRSTPPTAADKVTLEWPVINGKQGPNFSCQNQLADTLKEAPMTSSTPHWRALQNYFWQSVQPTLSSNVSWATIDLQWSTMGTCSKIQDFLSGPQHTVSTQHRAVL